MKFIKPESNQFSLLENFLLPYESQCVSLASHIRRKSPEISILINSQSLTEQSQILGIIFFDKTLLHCIPDPQKLENSEFQAAFTDFLQNQTVKCINGTKETTELFISCLAQLNQIPTQLNHYKLMTLESEPVPPPEELSCDDEIRRYTIDDLELLLDLQKKYIVKEVAPADKQVTDLECSISLKNILKNQLCYALYSDGEPVAKANTNAIGFNWGQLGGVYTHPLYRKNYYAWHLLYKLCTRFSQTQKKACLFVKENNNPAQFLYKRMGFKECNSFQIAYF